MAVGEDFDGWATVNQLDVWALPLQQGLNAVWHYLSKDGSKNGVQQLKDNLMRPLPGLASEVSDEVVSHELAMFTAAFAAKKKKA